MATLDPRIEAIRAKYNLAREDFWELPQKKGTWLAKHSALEAVAVQAKVDFEPPMVLESNSAEKVVALCVTGTISDPSAAPAIYRREWSIGEASPSNNKNAYPYAMAEKRGKDRVILKLVGLHGLVYSEEEMDSAPAATSSKPSAATTTQDPDITEGVKNWVAKEKAKIALLTRLPDLLMWQDEREAELHRLLKKAPDAHRDLMNYFQEVQNLLSKKEAAE